MVELKITRGLPGSGKSYKAEAWVAEDPKNRAEVNRDKIRFLLHGGRLGTYDQEKQVTAVAHASIESLLKSGVSVVSSDTNLVQKHAREIAKIGLKFNADIEVWDMTNVPPSLCIQRDRSRSVWDGDLKGPVGEDVIMDMYNRYIRGKHYPLPSPVPDSVDLPDDMYLPNLSKPTAVLVDIDGTVAKMNGRSPYDYSLVGSDVPNKPVIEAVRNAYKSGHMIIFVSGRPDSCRADTVRWLWDNTAVGFEALHMRKTGDNRNDAIVKREIFDNYIRDNYNVQYVIDDRQRVVDQYRAIGLCVLQCAPGDF